ncbi:MAG: hypothetical protein JW891_00885 [Candidatus Lokiarchaeota archaeon]|nr:hypothetical protein [Candidatus Lokiarchaeota archaeon]
MIKLNFSGSYYEMGFQFGSQIKDFFQLPHISTETIEFAKECRSHVKVHAPGILEELKGITDATNLDPELLDAFVLCLGKDMIEQTRKLFVNGIDFGCSTIAINNELTLSEYPIFARNYDWMESFKEFFTAINSDPRNGIANLSFTDHIVGRCGGMNREGLAMVIHAIPSYAGDWRPGLRMNVICRWVLDNFKTTKEAVKFFEKIPHVFGHGYLIADKGGDIKKIETAGEEVVVIPEREGFLALTNHFETKSLKKFEFKNFSFPNSRERMKKINNWFQMRQSQISIDHIKNLMSNHDTGVCNHFEYEGERTSTLWSWIAEVGTSQILLCDGSPCKTPYEPLNL